MGKEKLMGLVNQNQIEKHDHLNEVETLWRMSEENPIIKGLKFGHSWQEMLDSLNIQEAFKESPCSCGCSDGRIHEQRHGRAGEGLLIGVEKMVQQIGEMIENGVIKDKYEITSHDGCGAAKKVCDKLKEEGKLPADFNSDDLGIDFAKKLVAAAQEAFPEVKFTYRHIAGNEMDKDHGERAIYFDATGKINLETVKELPSGFVFSSMTAVDVEVTKKELSALCGIALGDHGFGDRFTKENPFWIVVSAENEEQKEVLMKIAEEVANNFDDKVKADGFLI